MFLKTCAWLWRHKCICERVPTLVCPVDHPDYIRWNNLLVRSEIDQFLLPEIVNPQVTSLWGHHVHKGIRKRFHAFAKNKFPLFCGRQPTLLTRLQQGLISLREFHSIAQHVAIPIYYKRLTESTRATALEPPSAISLFFNCWPKARS